MTTGIPPTAGPQKKTRKAVVLEIELDLADEVVKHLDETCENPLYCFSSFGRLASEDVVINAVEWVPAAEDAYDRGTLITKDGSAWRAEPAVLEGTIRRVRVNDVDWIDATRDSETKPMPTYTGDADDGDGDEEEAA